MRDTLSVIVTHQVRKKTNFIRIRVRVSYEARLFAEESPLKIERFPADDEMRAF